MTSILLVVAVVGKVPWCILLVLSGGPCWGLAGTLPVILLVLALGQLRHQ